jgi:hypothetical protein
MWGVEIRPPASAAGAKSPANAGFVRVQGTAKGYRFFTPLSAQYTTAKQPPTPAVRPVIGHETGSSSPFKVDGRQCVAFYCQPHIYPTCDLKAILYFAYRERGRSL